MVEQEHGSARWQLIGCNSTVFIASACIMIIELIAGRIISRYLGQSLYTWTSVIGVVLAGISIGNYVGGRLADRFRPRRTLAVLFTASAALCFLVPALNHFAGRSLVLLRFEWPLRVFSHVCLPFLLPSCALGMFSPVVAKMALECGNATGRTIGNIYAWGAAGSILGTFLAGFYLVAVAGTFITVAIVGLILIIMAVFYATGSWAARVGVWLGLVAMLGVAGPSKALAAVGTYLKFRAGDSSQGSIIFETESQYSYISVSADPAHPTRRTLTLDRLLHSGVDVANPTDIITGYVWVYEAIINKYSSNQIPVDVLVLGGGGYVAPRYLERTRPGSRIHVAEIDPKVTDVAFAYLGLNSNTTIQIHNIDARNCVTDLLRKKNEGGPVSFDYILGDSINDFSVPYQLTTKEFNKDLNDILSPAGLYLLHLADIFEVGRFLAAVINTAEETFPYVYVLAESARDDRLTTFMIVCSHKERDLSDISELIRTRHVTSGWVLLSPVQIKELQQRCGEIVLTDDFAPVENLLSEVVRRHRVDLFVEYLRLSSEAFLRKDYGQAERHLMMILSDDPEHAEAYYGLARVYVEQDLLDQAEEACGDAINYNTWHEPAQVLRGEIHARQGRLDEAMNAWKQVVRYFPRNTQALNDTAMVLEYQGKSDEAIAKWKAVLKISPEDSTAHFYLGKALRKAGHVQQAALHTQEARRLDPSLSRVQKSIVPSDDVEDSIGRMLF